MASKKDAGVWRRNLSFWRLVAMVEVARDRRWTITAADGRQTTVVCGLAYVWDGDLRAWRLTIGPMALVWGFL